MIHQLVDNLNNFKQNLYMINQILCNKVNQEEQ